jgi:hypothetical protein
MTTTHELTNQTTKPPLSVTNQSGRGHACEVQRISVHSIEVAVLIGGLRHADRLDRPDRGAERPEAAPGYSPPG